MMEEERYAVSTVMRSWPGHYAILGYFEERPAAIEYLHTSVEYLPRDLFMLHDYGMGGEGDIVYMAGNFERAR